LGGLVVRELPVAAGVNTTTYPRVWENVVGQQENLITPDVFTGRFVFLQRDIVDKEMKSVL
jgi:hypothetical protein